MDSRVLAGRAALICGSDTPVAVVCQIGQSCLPTRTSRPRGRFCVRVSARDVAGQAEKGETQKAWGDCLQQICRGQRGDWRLPETAETYVVWLITQRSRVQ